MRRATTSPLVRQGNRAGCLVVLTRVSELERLGLDRLVSEEKGETSRSDIAQIGTSRLNYYAPTAEDEAAWEETPGHLTKLGASFNQIPAAVAALVK